MQIADAVEFMKNAIASGRANRGFLVVGSMADALQFADGVLRLVFTDNLDQIERHTHPDVAWLEPEGRGRQIQVGSMRERIVEPMSVTAFSGGWKVGIIVGAERMTEAAANAFLKSLEEPTPRTMFLLLTDCPEGCLPTVISRSHRIDLPHSRGGLPAAQREQVEAVFLGRPPVGVHERMKLARRLVKLLGEFKDEAEDAEVPVVRQQFFETIIEVLRRWMVTGAVPRAGAFRNLEVVQTAYAQSVQYLSDELVLSGMMDSITFPPAPAS